MDLVGAVDDADMFRCLQQNGNGESSTTNTTTIPPLLSLLQLTMLLMESFWGCYFGATRLEWSWNENNGKAGNFYTVLSRGSYFVVMLHLKLN
jgi:hypothetical protein